MKHQPCTTDCLRPFGQLVVAQTRYDTMRFALHARPRPLSALLLVAVTTSACTRTSSTAAGASSASQGMPIVGPLQGSVLVVGGGAQGPEIFAKFIELAGGPDALIVEVPTAGGDSVNMATVGRGLRAAGARNVVAYHTVNRAVADADTFVAKIAGARGVWFGGGRHFRLVNSYAGTKSERAFQAVLDRGGVAGGSSAGASILASYLIRGAPSNDNRIMNHPQYLKGFSYLRNVAIDQHVVARERLADLHDSLTARRPDLLGISEDEGTAWVVRGDVGEIIGRNKAFVYNGRDANDAGKPFLTLHPGDKYDLARRRVITRAADATPLSQKFVDDLFKAYRDSTRGGATVLVAQDGNVLINSAYGIAVQRRFQPETGAPNSALQGLGGVLEAAATPDSSGRIGATSIRRVLTIGGMQRVTYDSVSRSWRGNVDDLYRFEQGRTALRPGARDTTTVIRGFATDTVNGMRRHSAFGTSNGTGSAWVRYPDRRTTILVLTNDGTADAKGLSQRMADRLFSRTSSSSVPLQSNTSLVGVLGNWTAVNDGGAALKIDGSIWNGAADPTRLDSVSRAIFTQPDAKFVTQATSAAAFPFAVARMANDFSNGTLNVAFKLIGGATDQNAGILFGLRPNGDYHFARYNTKDGNVAIWEYINGERKVIARGTLEKQLPMNTWHALVVTIKNGAVQATVLGTGMQVEHVFSASVPGRVGVWTKRDAITVFRNFRISPD